MASQVTIIIYMVHFFPKAAKEIRKRNYDRATEHQRIAKKWRAGGILALVIPLVILSSIVAAGVVFYVLALIVFIIILLCICLA